MEPIWKLLNSKRKDADWNEGFRGALRSAISNRQWTQERCHAAGFATHSRCLLCLHAATPIASVPLTSDGVPARASEAEAPTPTEASAMPPTRLATDLRIRIELNKREALRRRYSRRSGAAASAQTAAAATSQCQEQQELQQQRQRPGWFRSSQDFRPQVARPPRRRLDMDPSGNDVDAPAAQAPPTATTGALATDDAVVLSHRRRPLPTPTAEAIAATPIGNKWHRIWSCPTHELDRCKQAPPKMLGMSRRG